MGHLCQSKLGLCSCSLKMDSSHIKYTLILLRNMHSEKGVIACLVFESRSFQSHTLYTKEYWNSIREENYIHYIQNWDHNGFFVNLGLSRIVLWETFCHDRVSRVLCLICSCNRFQSTSFKLNAHTFNMQVTFSTDFTICDSMKRVSNLM